MILVTGVNGFVGHKIMEMCKDTVASPSLRTYTMPTLPSFDKQTLMIGILRSNSSKAYITLLDADASIIKSK